MSNTKHLRSPLVKAFDNWLASDDGRQSSDPETLGAEPEVRHFLENRLVDAFCAGAKAQEQIDIDRIEKMIRGQS